MKRKFSHGFLFRGVAIVFSLTLLITTGPVSPASNHAQAQDPPRNLHDSQVRTLPARDKRWALIIGVNNFGLKGAVNDARALKNVLVKYAGFPDDQVVLLTTDNAEAWPTQRNILIELDNLSRRMPADGLLLFSFSGHGKTVQNNAYLIPSDGRLTKVKRLLMDFSIDVNRIKEAIEEMKIKQVLMFIDACRDRIEGPERGGGNEPLTPVMSRAFDVDNENVEAFATLYATRVGESAYEYYDDQTKEWRGYFGKALEDALSGGAANDKGEITLAALIKYLEDWIPASSYRNEGIKQTPWSNSSGYRNAELVLALAPRPVVWSSLGGLAKKLMKYDFVGHYSEDLAPVELKDKWGFINRSGAVVVSLKYDSVYSHIEGLAPVGLNEKWGFIDDAGRERVPLKYDEVYSFHDGLAAVRLKEKWGFIDKAGKVVIPINYDYVNSFSEGLAGVGSNEKYGFVDRSGTVVIPLKYIDVSDFAGGLAAVSPGPYPSWEFIDSSGNVVLTGYDSARNFAEGFVQVGTESEHKPYKTGFQIIYKWGFINRSGKAITENKYDETSPFSEGRAVVVKDGKQGFIDTSGNEIIPLRYDVDECGCDCSSFSDGIAKVTLNKKVGFIDLKGREVISPKYDKVWCWTFKSDGFIGVELNGKKGFVDVRGNEFWNF